jgi:asparagine synthase (glutamine-hydrolysing)
VKVALGGDGGDELLGGYPTYVAHRLAQQYRRWPRWLRQGVVAPAVQRLPVSFRYMSLEFRLKRFISGAEDDSPALRHARWMGILPIEELAGVVHSDWVRQITLDDLQAPYLTHWQGENSNVVSGAMRCDFHLYLQELVLTKVDRASMAVALEVRAPFLDVQLMEWLAALPVAWKVRGLRGKYLLRRAVGDALPPAILRRPKQGFALPIARWFQGPLRTLLGDMFSEARLARSGWWDVTRVRQLLDSHWRHQADHSRVLWALLVFELWREDMLKTDGPSACST